MASVSTLFLSIHNLGSWHVCLGKKCCSDAIIKFPVDMLEKAHPLPLIDRTLAAFILEARRGTPYPGSTLKNILATLYCRMKECQGAVNITTFLNAQLQAICSYIHHALDRQLRFLRDSRIGIECKCEQIITPVIDTKLWEKGGIGSSHYKLFVVLCWEGVLPPRG